MIEPLLRAASPTTGGYGHFNAEIHLQMDLPMLGMWLKMRA
jgi:hypothetical protein